MFLYIQGAFYKEQSSIGIEYDASGKVPVIGRYLDQTLYQGIITDSPEDTAGRLRGVMEDRYGVSALDEIVYRDNEEFCFQKTYRDREYAIAYRFTKKVNGVWLGTYAHENTGVGITACLAVEADPILVTPERIVAELGLKKAFVSADEMRLEAAQLKLFENA